jgi:hypothetical protein
MSYDAERSEYVKTNKARFAHYAARQRDKLKLELVKAYGGECKHCGESDPVVLCLDHINDDAWVEIQQYGLNARGGHKQYQRLKKLGWPQDRFQLLCFNCNAKKEHQRRRDQIAQDWGEFEFADKRNNLANVARTRSNTSGAKGVFWNSGKRKWQAKMMVDYAQVHLGFYDSFADAAKAYRKAALERWGDTVAVLTDEEIEALASGKTFGGKMTCVEESAEDLGL